MIEVGEAVPGDGGRGSPLLISSYIKARVGLQTGTRADMMRLSGSNRPQKNPALTGSGGMPVFESKHASSQIVSERGHYGYSSPQK